MKVFKLPYIFTLGFLLIIFSTAVYSQTKVLNRQSRRVVDGDEVYPFLDSLKASLFKDTMRFDTAHLQYQNGETLNRHPYSKIFCLDGRYLYRLDIIPGYMVTEFVEEVLDPDKIESIAILESNTSYLIFGPNARLGSFMITRKKNGKIKVKVAGLRLFNKGKSGDNFFQKPKGSYIMWRT